MSAILNTAQLLPILFIYGLASFSMGLVILLESRRSTTLELARFIPFLSAFGILYSMVEWAQMFIVASDQVTGLSRLVWVEILILALLVASSTSLVFFGSSLIARFRSNFSWLTWAAPGLLICWMASEWVISVDVTMMSTDWLIRSAMMVRYFLFLPGCIMATMALFLQAEALERFETPSLPTDCVWAGIAFALNALVTTLVVPENGSVLGSILSYLTFVEPTNVYVQVLRTTVAVVIAIFVVRIMRVFEVENRKALEKADTERFQAQQEAIELQREAQERVEQWNRELEQRIAERTTELEQTNSDLSAMNAVAGSVSRSLEIDQILNDSLEKIIAVGRMEAGVIYLMDRETNQFTLRASAGISAGRMDLLQSQPFDDTDSFLGQVFSDGRALLLEDAPADAWFRGIPGSGEEPYRSVVGVPLKAKGMVLGVMKLATRDRTHLSSRDVELLVAIGQQLAVAIDNAQLFWETQLRQRESEALLRVSTEISALARIDRVLKLVVEKACGLVDSDVAAIGLVDNHTREIYIKATYGAESERLSDLRQERGMGVIGRVVETGQDFSGRSYPVLSEIMAHGVIDQAIVDSGIQSHTVVPLQVGDEVIGVMIVGKREDLPFGGEECSLLKRLANQASIALHNARLYDEVQRLAIHEERYRIAREMHDGLAQVLGYFNLQTKNLDYLLRSGDTEQVLSNLQEMNRLAADSYADVRESILGLRTSVSSGQGLVPALREYIDKYSRLTKLTVYLDCRNDLTGIPAEVEAQLMRIVQEGLTNIRKHARASIAWVKLEQQGDQLQAIIEDNGIGFDKTQIPNDGQERFGLSSMKERAASVGGNLVLESLPGKGTRISLSLPLRTDSEVLLRSSHL